MQAADPSRQERERQFHNESFAEGTRARTGKFYAIHRGSQAAYDDAIRDRAAGSDVLEYGCGRGSAAFDLAAAGARVTGIDISDVAIAMAAEHAHDLRLAGSLRFEQMDAEHLAFDDASFDLVCGSSILHHLDLEAAYAEVARVLRPGGQGIFVEALGHNPLINLYRRRTPELRTTDEHPLRVGDIAQAEAVFPRVDARYFNLATLAALPLRSRASFPRTVELLEDLDQAMFRRIPYLRRHAWMVVLRLTR